MKKALIMMILLGSSIAQANIESAYADFIQLDQAYEMDIMEYCEIIEQRQDCTELLK